MPPTPDLDQAVKVLDVALDGTKLGPAWRVVRRHARRSRRVSQTLPRVLGLAQHATIAISRIDELFVVLPPELYERTRVIRDHLVAMRDALRTGREDEETKPKIDLEDP